MKPISGSSPLAERSLHEPEARHETLIPPSEILKVPAEPDQPDGTRGRGEIGFEHQCAIRKIRASNLPREGAGWKLRVREHAVPELAETLPSEFLA